MEIRTSFTGGEISPLLYGQIGHPKYKTGIKTGLNVICTPYGPAQNRAGFEMIREVKNSSTKTRLIPYIFNNDQAYVIELGNQYMRFHTEGGTILSGSTPYESTSPFLEADLFEIAYTSPEADVMTMTHRSYAPRELKRTIGSPIAFTVSQITFGPAIVSPSNVSASATGTGTVSYTYVVTTMDQNGIEESIASTANSCTNDLNVAGQINTISWTAVTGASRYHVYKSENGMFGYVGRTSNTSFIDNNIDADTLAAPPENQSHLLSSSDNYPGAVTYFEQRRVFGGTNNEPQSIVMTRGGTESNLTRSVPMREDDALKIPIKGMGRIRHLVSVTDLIALTSNSSSSISSKDSDFITYKNVWPRNLDGSAGANGLRPIIARDTVLFGEAMGSHIAEMYFGENARYATRDISVLANHLVDGYSIVDWTFMRTPYPVVWAVRNDGVLLSLTYLPDRSASNQGILAWTQHTTDGFFESVTVIPESTGEEKLYAVIKRTINGATKRFVERMKSRRIDDIKDSFFVDCGLTYNGSAASTITGLDHLEGKTVAVVADGIHHPNQVVNNGQISLQAPASKVHVGLPYVSDIETLPLVLQKEAYGQGQKKNVTKVFIRVDKTMGVKVGHDADHLEDHLMRAPANFGDPVPLITEEIAVQIPPDWNREGSLLMRQDRPLPLTILSFVMEVQ